MLARGTTTIDHLAHEVFAVPATSLAGLDEFLHQLLGLLLRRLGELHTCVEHPLENWGSSHELSLPTEIPAGNQRVGHLGQVVA